MEKKEKSLDSYSRTINVNVTTETGDVQYEIEKVRLGKKRELFAKLHGTYSTAIYGSPAEKEVMNKEHRAALLDQVHQKEQTKKVAQATKVSESQVAVAYDKKCIESDRKDYVKRANYLKQFRDENKKLMEERAEEERRRRAQQNKHDRELTKINPINWNNTLR